MYINRNSPPAQQSPLRLRPLSSAPWYSTFIISIKSSWPRSPCTHPDQWSDPPLNNQVFVGIIYMVWSPTRWNCTSSTIIFTISKIIMIHDEINLTTTRLNCTSFTLVLTQSRQLTCRHWKRPFIGDYKWFW